MGNMGNAAKAQTPITTAKLSASLCPARERELCIAPPDDNQRNERCDGANARAERESEWCPRPVCNGACLQAAKRNHGAEHERPNPHDSSAHFIGHDRLQDGV